ncbi:MAG TPA: SPOR domain-containing protein [Longimicrobiales bacterium]|nr:SPOR domain-containing protein [Longimicrobiales bacterium]
MKIGYRFARAALLLALLPAPVAAQALRASTNVYASGIWFSSLTPDGPVDTRLQAGWLTGMQTERWLSDALGVRLNAAYTERGFDYDGEVDVNFWLADVDLLYRIGSHFDRVLPYAVLGAGVSHYNLGHGARIEMPGASWIDHEVTRPVAVLGLGADVLPTHRMGFRVEVSDHLAFRSPAQHPDMNYGLMHQVRFSSGMRVSLGELVGRPFLARRSGGEPPEAGSVAVSATIAAGAEHAGLEAAAAARAMEARVVALQDSLAEARWRAERSARAYPAGARPPLYTVQVAAFRDFTHAETELIAQRLRSRGLPVWLAREEAVDGGTLHHVRVGALGTEDEAYALARVLARDHGWPVWVAPIAFGDGVPSDAVAATREALGGL